MFSVSSLESWRLALWEVQSDTYYLEEIKAPKGYRQIKKLLPMKISAKYMKERNDYIKGEGDSALEDLSGELETNIFFNNSLSNDVQTMERNEEDILTVDVINRKGSALPKTGSIKFLLFIAGGILLTVMGSYVGKKDSDKQDS